MTANSRDTVLMIGFGFSSGIVTAVLGFNLLDWQFWLVVLWAGISTIFLRWSARAVLIEALIDE